jgi:hypothetical protein
VNGLQRVRPGTVVAPRVVRMDGKPDTHADASQGATAVVQR